MKTYRIVGLVLLALALLFPLFTLAQDAGTNAPPAPVLTPTGNDGVVLGDPTGLLTKLTKQWPWLTVLFGWVVTLRLFAKPFSNWIQGLFDQLLLFVKRTPEKDDDEFVYWVLTTKLYRFFAFVVDWATSIKLPTSDSMADTAAEIAAKNSAKANGRVGLFLIGALAFGASGCETVQVKEGHDPIVVHAEYLAENGLNSVNQFLQWERNHEAAWLKKNPGIHQFADSLRAQKRGEKGSAELQIIELRALTKQYKADRTAANGDKVRLATATVLSLVNTARTHAGLPPLVLPSAQPSVRDLMKPVAP